MIKYPVIVDESGDIQIYPSISEVELNLESIDVKSGAYVAYDAHGQVLELSTILKPRKFFFGLCSGLVEYVLVKPTTIYKENELRKKLVELLITLGKLKKDDRQYMLFELILMLENYQRLGR